MRYSKDIVTVNQEKGKAGSFYQQDQDPMAAIKY